MSVMLAPLYRLSNNPGCGGSRVIKRALWADRRRTAGELMEALDSLPLVDRVTLDGLDEGQASDAPPEDPRNRD